MTQDVAQGAETTAAPQRTPKENEVLVLWMGEQSRSNEYARRAGERSAQVALLTTQARAFMRDLPEIVRRTESYTGFERAVERAEREVRSWDADADAK